MAGQSPVRSPQPAVLHCWAACQQLQQRVEELEDELSCPITLQPLEDPVLLVASGQTFSRAAIEEHWRRRRADIACRCPVTKIDIGDRLALSPNFMVRRQLDGLLRLKAQLAKETENARIEAGMLALFEGHTQAQPAAAADADSTEGEYTWGILDSSAHLRLTSDQFEVCSRPWKLLVCPRGNIHSQFVAVFLVMADAEKLPVGGHMKATIRLMLVNQRHPARSITRVAAHTFTPQAPAWGFNKFALQKDVLDVRNGYLMDDTLVLKVVVSDDMMHDSKKETGFLGLQNQGATCYLNSLLQSLYNINYFRQAVYHMPITEKERPNKSIPLAMQALFYKLQFGDTSVSTKDLTQSVGWDKVDAFYQHDAQELSRVLCEKLEEKLKNTRIQGAVSHLFEGHLQSLVECVNVEFKSAQKETYMDLSLDVKNCKNVYESMEQYTKMELLDGDNQDRAEGFGLQDARKGIQFEDFPSVLQLHLKRFGYDFQRGVNVKVNKRYVFPEQLDLDHGFRKLLAKEADQSIRNLFKLHSVLLHNGGVHGSHYYASIRPDGKQWLKFDDHRVTKASETQAVDEQYGGEAEYAPAPGLTAPNFKFITFSNAYCLVYVREAEWSEIMVNVTSSDIAWHARARLEAASAQLGKVQTLCSIGQFDNARLLLRETPFSRFRQDVREVKADTFPDNERSGAVAALEMMDGRLKKHPTKEQCQDLTASLKQELLSLTRRE